MDYKITESYSQKKNNKNESAALVFKKAKLGDSAYYAADIYCPGEFHCGFDNRCQHPISLFAKKNIFILSYSYIIRDQKGYFDSLAEAKPLSPKKLTDSYTHAFFKELNILYNGDSITLKDIPIEVFAHGLRKIKGANLDKSYFLFIPIKKDTNAGIIKNINSGQKI